MIQCGELPTTSRYLLGPCFFLLSLGDIIGNNIICYVMLCYVMLCYVFIYLFIFIFIFILKKNYVGIER